MPSNKNNDSATHNIAEQIVVYAGGVSPTSGKKNYYDILGVSRTATLDEIKKAYFKQAKILHPDKARTKEQANALNAAMQTLNAAWAALQDAAERAKYDEILKRGGLTDKDLYEQIQQAIYANDVSKLQELRTQGYDISKTGKDGTALFLAIRLNKIAVVQYLLGTDTYTGAGAGIDPNTKGFGKFGRSAFAEALHYKNAAVVKELLKAKADIPILDKNGWSTLSKIIQDLKSELSVRDFTPEQQESLAIKAVFFDDTNMVRLLFANNINLDLNFNLPNQKGTSIPTSTLACAVSGRGNLIIALYILRSRFAKKFGHRTKTTAEQARSDSTRTPDARPATEPSQPKYEPASDLFAIDEYPIYKKLENTDPGLPNLLEQHFRELHSLAKSPVMSNKVLEAWNRIIQTDDAQAAKKAIADYLRKYTAPKARIRRAFTGKEFIFSRTAPASATATDTRKQLQQKMRADKKRRK